MRAGGVRREPFDCSYQIKFINLKIYACYANEASVRLREREREEEEHTQS